MFRRARSGRTEDELSIWGTSQAAGELTMLRFAAILVTVLCAVIACRAQRVDTLPAYEPQQIVTGNLRLWGHGSPTNDFMGKLVRSWEEGFRKYHPGVQFENRMYGTASAMGALYAGAGDLAIM